MANHQAPTGADYNCCYANAFENTFQMMAPQIRPARYPRPYQTHSHYNSTYSDGQIYDQPPSPSIEPPQPSPTYYGMQGHQRLYEGLRQCVIPPVPPATAPASRRRFGRSNYESEEIDGDDEVNNGRGGTLSRRRPIPPAGILINQYSRDSLNNVSASLASRMKIFRKQLGNDFINYEFTFIPHSLSPSRSCFSSL